MGFNDASWRSMLYSALYAYWRLIKTNKRKQNETKKTTNFKLWRRIGNKLCKDVNVHGVRRFEEVHINNKSSE